MGKHRNAFQAIEIDLDCITFWKEEEITPTTTIQTEDTYKTCECRLCTTEYAGRYCPKCGLLHGE